MKWTSLWPVVVFPALIWLAWPASDDSATPPAGKPVNPPAGLAQPVPDQGFWLPPPVTEDEVVRVPLLPIDQSQPASLSLARAHAAGDERTPPIERVADTPAASAAELADPKAYAAREARQNLRVYAQFVQAADQILPQLRSDIERGRQLGIPPEKIARAEEKLRRIAAERASLLQQHPELGSAGR